MTPALLEKVHAFVSDAIADKRGFIYEAAANGHGGFTYQGWEDAQPFSGAEVLAIDTACEGLLEDVMRISIYVESDMSYTDSAERAKDVIQATRQILPPARVEEWAASLRDQIAAAEEVLALLGASKK